MGKKLTTEEFIKKSKEKFGDKYDYSLVEYKNYETKVKIKCPEHGVFFQTPNIHILSKCGCQKCSGYTKTNVEDFLKKTKEIYGDKYDYSLVDYVNVEKKVKIICPEHGVFEKTPHSHISGKQGCKKCLGKYKETIDFIKKAKEIHGDKYDYSEVNYFSSKIKIKIICSKHGEFYQEANSHLKGNGCPKCAGKNKNTIEFIEEAKRIHGDKYNYNFVEYRNSKIKIKIICKKHGAFYQSPSSHLIGNGCHKCNSKAGESKVRNFLEKNKINYIPQKTFENCKYKRLLLFDFYIPELNICIEYDGEQHFKAIEIFGGEKKFKEQKIKDKIKTDYCNKNNIELIRIKYNENIEDVLVEKLLCKV